MTKVNIPSSVVTSGMSGPPAWAASTTYTVNQVVTYRGNTWVCATAHTSGTSFIFTNWTQIGSSASLSLFSPKQFGAIGDAKTSSTGAVNGGSTVFNDTMAAWFTSADVGKVIGIVQGSASKAGGVHCTQYAVIQAVVSSTQITLSQAVGLGQNPATYVFGTDDSAAIQAAANASETEYTATQTRGGVQLDGHFVTTVSITSGIHTSWIGNGPAVSGIHGIGSVSAGPIILSGGSASAPLAGCVFKGFEIDGSGMSNSSYGVAYKGLSAANNVRCLFEDLWVHDCPATGLAFDGPFKSVAYGCVVEKNGRLDDGTETTTGIGGNGIGNGTGTLSEESAIITACIAIGNAKHGIYWERNGGATSFSEYVVTDCIAVGNRDGFADNSGSASGNGSKATFTNCRARANARYGFVCDTSLTNSNPGLETVFQGCIADGNGGGGFYYNASNISTSQAADYGKISWSGGKLVKNGTMFSLSTLLSTSAAITSLPVTALPTLLPISSVLTVMSGGYSQQWTTTVQAIAGATTVTVTSQTPNYAYPASSVIVNGITAAGIGLGMGTPTMQGFSVRGAEIYQNVSSGILINQLTGSAALTDLDIRDNNIWGNATADPNNTGGIKIANTTTNYCQIVDNHCWDPSSASKVQVSGVELASGASITYLNMQGNDLRGNKTNTLLLNATLSSPLIINNPGYNPVGASSVTPGASPYTYTAGAAPETVTIAGGSVSQIAIGNSGSTVNTSLTSGAFNLSVGQTLIVTYSAAPTMVSNKL